MFWTSVVNAKQQTKTLITFEYCAIFVWHQKIGHDNVISEIASFERTIETQTIWSIYFLPTCV